MVDAAVADFAHKANAGGVLSVNDLQLRIVSEEHLSGLVQLSVAVHVAVDGASCRSNDQIMPSAVIPDSVDVIDAGPFA